MPDPDICTLLGDLNEAQAEFAAARTRLALAEDRYSAGVTAMKKGAGAPPPAPDHHRHPVR